MEQQYKGISNPNIVGSNSDCFIGARGQFTFNILITNIFCQKELGATSNFFWSVFRLNGSDTVEKMTFPTVPILAVKIKET